MINAAGSILKGGALSKDSSRPVLFAEDHRDRNSGIPRFFEHLTQLVGPDAKLSSSWCIDMNVVRYLKGIDVLPREHLTCVDKEVCLSDIECIAKLVGGVNSENLMVAKRGDVQRGCPLTGSYNFEDALVYCEPSPYQLAFAQKSEEKRKEEVLKEARIVYKQEVLKEARIVYKQVRKAKQHKRKN